MIALAHISEAPLSLEDHIAAVSAPHSGAVASFVGLVRNHDPAVSGTVVGLDYSAHPDAQEWLERIVSRVTHPRVTSAVSHRVGSLAVGEAAIVVASAAAHRAEAFEECRAIVEAVKAELPVWKRERLADGSHSWVGMS